MFGGPGKELVVKKNIEKCSKHGFTLTVDRGGNEYCLECARELRKTMARAYTSDGSLETKLKKTS